MTSKTFLFTAAVPGIEFRESFLSNAFLVLEPSSSSECLMLGVVLIGDEFTSSGFTTEEHAGYRSKIRNQIQTFQTSISPVVYILTGTSSFPGRAIQVTPFILSRTVSDILILFTFRRRSLEFVFESVQTFRFL